MASRRAFDGTNQGGCTEVASNHGVGRYRQLDTTVLESQRSRVSLRARAPLNAVAPQGSSLYRIPFLQSKKTMRKEIAMFGSNDGMFHVLDARVGVATSGREIFAYVPRSLYPTLKELTAPAYIHRYFVDGPVVEGDVWNGTAWKTIAIGIRAAGRQDCSRLTSPHPTRRAQRVAYVTMGQSSCGNCRR